MKFKILKVIKKGDNISMVFETEFGKDKFRCKQSDKVKDKLTGKPVWLLKLGNYIRKKYELMDQFSEIPYGFNSYMETDIDIETIEDTRPSNIGNIQEESVKDMKAEIIKQNQIIRDLTTEHHALVDARRVLEKKIKKIKSTSGDKT